MNVTRLPWLGPKHRSPCQASGFRSVPQPERSPSPTWRSPALRDDRRDQLLPGEGPPSSASRTAPPQRLHLLRGHPEVALPARPLPGPPGGHQREERAGLLGREEMQRAAHRPGLDQPAVAQGAADLAVPRRLAPDADRELGRRGDLRLDAAEPADDVRDGQPADRIEQVAPHSPCERLLPADRHRHPLSLRRLRSTSPPRAPSPSRMARRHEIRRRELERRVVSPRAAEHARQLEHAPVGEHRHVAARRADRRRPARARAPRARAREEAARSGPVPPRARAQAARTAAGRSRVGQRGRRRRRP